MCGLAEFRNADTFLRGQLKLMWGRENRQGSEIESEISSTGIGFSSIILVYFWESTFTHFRFSFVEMIAKVN